MATLVKSPAGYFETLLMQLLEKKQAEAEKRPVSGGPVAPDQTQTSG